jgi:UDP-N-acetylmuramoyl-tripeptide--D-alanyl-D-alanine ligase
VLFRTTFIAVTGSVGKTTAKEILAAILASRHPTVCNFANQNDKFGVPRTILRVRPWHRYAVIEMSGSKPGAIRSLARLARPSVALILAVKPVHRKAMRTLESVAAEKASLLDALPRNGIAVLHGDDPRVCAMQAPPGVRVWRFGTRAEFDCQASEIESVWPDRLHFRLRCKGQEAVVRSQLVGGHWVPSVLGATAVAVALGFDPRDAVEPIAAMEPVAGRMQPVSLPGGAIMLRDDKDGQAPTLDPALEVLRHARGVRRVVVLSDVSDVSAGPRDRQRRLGRLAARCADVAVFVGSHADYARDAAIREGLGPQDAHCFVDLRKAAEFLRSSLRPGDLALLKGRVNHHLARIYFAQLGSVACWKQRCPILSLCDLCPELRPGLERIPSEPAPAQPGRFVGV